MFLSPCEKTLRNILSFQEKFRGAGGLNQHKSADRKMLLLNFYLYKNQ